MAIDWEKVKNQKARLEERGKKSSSTSARWWRPTVGDNRVRVMPGWDAEGDFAGQFWREVAQHWGVSDDQRGPILCPNKTPNLSGSCPVCDFVEQLKADKSDLRAQEIAKDIRAKTAFLLNVVDMDDPEYTAKDIAEFKKNFPEKECTFDVGDPKVQVYAAPQTVFNQILSVMTTNDVDLTDPKSGHDINIKRSGKGLLTRYETTIIIKPSEAPEGELNELDQLGFIMDEPAMIGLLASGVGSEFAGLLPANTPSTVTTQEVVVDDEDLGTVASADDLSEQLKAAMNG